MTTPSLMPSPLQTFRQDNGLPAAWCKLYCFDAGTSTPRVAYQDAAGLVPHENPITLDAKGEALIYFAGNYKVDLRYPSGAQVTGYPVDNFQTAIGAGDLIADSGSALVKGTWFGGVLALVSDLAGYLGASLIGFLQAGAGAVLRSIESKLRDQVSVFDFLSPAQIADIRNGTQTPALDPTADIQAGINGNTTYAVEFCFPPGVYRLTAPLKTAMPGQRLRGTSQYGVYFTAPAAAVFDMIRVAHQRCEVSGFIFRPSTATQTPIRVYAGRAHIHHNYLLAAVNNAGTGILQTDIDPETLAFVPGAYAHTIDNNTIGDAGFAFATGIGESSTVGITATKFRENRILSNQPIVINKGGGNTYSGNLLQSSTGTAGTKAGVGISLGATVSGEKIFGNYVELFLAMFSTTNTSTGYQIFYAVGNHNDNCAAPVSDAGSKNYVIEDAVSLVENRNGWSTSYASASLWALSTPTAKTSFAVDGSGNCFMGASTGASHGINRIASTENDVVLNLLASGASFGYFQDARTIGASGANSGLVINKNTVTGRSINAAGTVNASGADYAEYERNNGLSIAKGAIVGFKGDGMLTLTFAEAVRFGIKSTSPSFTGGDVWSVPLGPRPTDPLLIPDYETALEAARVLVDRVAYAGKVPVNVTGAAPGDYIIAVDNAGAIGGQIVAAPSFDQYRAAVGRVNRVLPDGRTEVAVIIH